MKNGCGDEKAPPREAGRRKEQLKICQRKEQQRKLVLHSLAAVLLNK